MILITGVAGFIGSNVAKRLIGYGFTVIGIDNFDDFYSRKIKEENIRSLQYSEKFIFREGDIGDRKFLDTLPARPDVVIHLAAKAGVQPSLKSPQDYIDVNLSGTLNILEWMKTKQINKFIFASSSSVYGNNNKIPFSEKDTDIFPVSPYALTKRSCELMNHTYHHLYNLDVINLRFFTVYGPGQRPDLAIHKFIRAAVDNLPITLYGKGDTRRDYTFIDDIAQGIFSAYRYIMSNHGIFETINLGNNTPVSLSDLIRIIEKVTGKNIEKIYIAEQPGDMRVTFASIEKAKKLLSYRPSTTLEEGIRIFYQWYLKKNNIHESPEHRYSYLQRREEYTRTFFKTEDITQ